MVEFYCEFQDAQFDEDPPVFFPVDESGARITTDTEPIETYKVRTIE